MEGHIAYISVGSNIGDKLQNCQKGILALKQPLVSKLRAQSPFYLSEPVDYKAQDWFINAVIKIETTLKPFPLLEKLKAIQHRAGRKHHRIRYGPRILDMDILLYDDRVIGSPGLKIPHPRMHKRRFVLQPICDIDKTIVHPVFKKDMKNLLDNLDNDGQRLLEYKCDY